MTAKATDKEAVVFGRVGFEGSAACKYDGCHIYSAGGLPRRSRGAESYSLRFTCVLPVRNRLFWLFPQ